MFFYGVSKPIGQILVKIKAIKYKVDVVRYLSF